MSPAQFLGRLFYALRDDGFDPLAYPIDHVCYRVETMQRYEELKSYWNARSDWQSEKQVNGRPISVFRLTEPFVFESCLIPLLELAAPKVSDNSYPEGFEHAEFVTGGSLDEFMAAHPGLSFETKGVFKPVNPEIRLTYAGMSAKFHERDLETVIRYFDPTQ